MLKRPLIAAALLLAVANAAVADEVVDGLLAKVAEAYGGTEIIMSTDAVMMSGLTHSTMRGTAGPIARVLRYPDSLLVEIAYEGQEAERRVIVGGQGWRKGDPVHGGLYDSMLLQLGRTALPRLLFDHRSMLVDHGPVAEGSNAHALEVPLGNDRRLLVEIDTGTGYILRSMGLMQMAGTEMAFGTAYENHRMHEGRLFAFREIHYAGGQETGFTEIEKVAFPESLPEGVFDP